MKSLVLLITFAFLHSAYAAKTIGNPKAPKGGIFYLNLNAEPSSLHPITSNDLYKTAVNSYIIDSLLNRNIQTYEWEPAIAESYKVSKDGMKYTFKIRKGLKFHDGKPLTIEDVKFSFDVYFMKGYEGNVLKGYYENINSPKIVDESTIEFTVKTKYHLNFDFVAGLSILPKHIYGDVKKGKKMTRKSIGSGPYKLKRWQKGKRIQLEKNKDWYGWGDKALAGQHNFNSITFRFARDKNIAMEMLKKGNIDYVDMDPEEFVRKTKGPMWGKSLFKHKVVTKVPKKYRYVGFNFKKPKFQDVRVRKALAHLFNRDLIIKKFYYGLYEKMTGPVSKQSYFANKNVKPIDFDPQKALKLLREAGWKDTDKDGILDKVINGKKTPMKITLVNANPNVNKFYTVYKEDAKKVGVHIDIKLIEWNSLVKLLDEDNFDVVALGWGGGSINWDPRQIWHSKSAYKGGSNHISYKNSEVDKLIDKARTIMDPKKRKKVLDKVYAKIAADVPYIFLFSQKYDLYGNTKRMKMQQPSYDYAVGTGYWWIEK